MACSLALLVACGDSADSPNEGTTAASASPAAPGGSPSVESMQDARDEYLRLLEPAGRAAGALGALLEDPNAEIGAVREAVEAYATAAEKWGTGLQGRTWPEEVPAPIAELTSQLLGQVEPTRAAAQGATVEEIQEQLAQIPGVTAAEQVRKAFEAADH